MKHIRTGHARMSKPCAVTKMSADDLFYGFDIPDEETREFLASLIESGQAPRSEVYELQELSIMRGAEEWDMLFNCASILRKKSELAEQYNEEDTERSLVPFLEALLCPSFKSRCLGPVSRFEAVTARSTQGTPRAHASRRKALKQGGTSHFWGDHGGGQEKTELKQRHQLVHSFPATTVVGNRDLRAAGVSSTKEHDDDLARLIAFEQQGTPSAALVAPPMECLFLPKPATEEQVKNSSRVRLHKHPADLTVEATQTNVRAVKATSGSVSPFFGTTTPTRGKKPQPSLTPPSTAKRPRPPRGVISSLPVPPLTADRFGLIQEELADNPFRLLIAITFLIRTTGKVAIPVFRKLMERFPTPETLAAADPQDITALIRPLGLSAVRCAAIQNYAHMWLEKPPTREVRYGVKNYPQPGDARHVRAGEEFGPEDGRGNDDFDDQEPVDAVADARDRAIGCAWEIGHLTQGPYTLDSWRIFCRDVLLGRSDDWTGRGSPPGFQPEWMRVLPRDKELRACLRWMWYVLLARV